MGFFICNLTVEFVFPLFQSTDVHNKSLLTFRPRCCGLHQSTHRAKDVDWNRETLIAKMYCTLYFLHSRLLPLLTVLCTGAPYACIASVYNYWHYTQQPICTHHQWALYVWWSSVNHLFSAEACITAVCAAIRMLCSSSLFKMFKFCLQ